MSSELAFSSRLPPFLARRDRQDDSFEADVCRVFRRSRFHFSLHLSILETDSNHSTLLLGDSP